MLRINTVVGDDGAVTMYVEGKLAGESVAVLAQECRRLRLGAQPVRVEVSGVTYADRDGVALLLGLAGHDVVVSGSSAFIQEQLSREHV